ncbi:unnamed protein product [Rotaria sp. Silwood1]|nr:unnamed protein product [Rotaria sp. Silwood1]CAF0737730.1 unnamed protein product [Rotaria sp. Silwood1]CAF3348683.1 unnamed protein product [Rotaria sp. Silwood1]CAF4629275.1 unnamed protein product [Rotaria sp. Silwood1]
MPNKIRFCILCKRYDRKNRSSYTRICTIEREKKILEGYRRRYNEQELNQPILNQLVHQKCYNKLVRCIPSIDSNDNLTPIEQKQDDNDEEQDQTSLIQFRSRMPLPSNINKHLFERRQRVCAVCNRYGYRSHNKMKQIVSNFMANKLAEGFSHIYKRPYGKSLLDAYIHETCFRKLYSSYRYHASKKIVNRNSLQNQEHFVRQLVYSPHETRSRTSLNKSSLETESKDHTSKITTDETANLSIERLFSTPLYTSVSTTNPNIELSARSCLFRPCIQRLTTEEIEFYTKRNRTSGIINEDSTLTKNPLPIVRSSITLTNDPVIYSNQDDNGNDLKTNEQDQSPDWLPTHPSSSSPVMFNNKQKICTAAKIRRRYLKPPPLAKPTNPLISDHTYINNNIYLQKIPADLEKLYQWLIEDLRSSGNPISMGEVLIKYKELIEETNTNTTRENIYRERLRHQLEKFYSNQFIFVTPNKREGTFIALNDIDHYVRLAIKNAKQEKDKATEASILSSIIVPPAPIDHKRQTCEAIMNGIRKIRLYIRDPKQLNTLPSLLIRNIIGLITTSEKQFHKISQQYDFYRMIDEDLFDNTTNNNNSGNSKILNKFDKNLRNMSLASDLISARHDNRISEKHFLLADEFTKKDFNCTPKQIITLLNRYGHTCSYKSYMKMKALKQRTTNELGQEIIEEIENIIRNDDKSSDSEMDLMEF